MSVFGDTHQIEKYSLKVTEHIGGAENPAMDRYIYLKLKPLTHGLEPDVYLNFDSYYSEMSGRIARNNIFNAVMYIFLNTSRFDTIYAVLRSEQPVYFTYSVAANYTDPAETATNIDVLQFSIHTLLEPVGEVERHTSISGLITEAVFAENRRSSPRPPKPGQ